MKTSFVNLFLESVSTFVNRSKHQTQFLFELCDKDFDKYLLLEEKIKNNFLGCPGDKETVDEYLNQKSLREDFNFSKLRWMNEESKS